MTRQTSIHDKRFYSVQYVHDLTGGDYELEALNEVCAELGIFPVIANDEICYHADVWWEAYNLNIMRRDI